MKKIGILISNLGTPKAPTPKAVRAYLREFLSDPYVVDKPRWFWLPILYGIILNIRPKSSAKKYQNIWQDEGSPLLIYSKKITEKLQQARSDLKISLGMRYGKPSLEDALTELEQAKIDELIILPLYPQYSFSTNKSTIERIKLLLRKKPDIKIHTIEEYHQHPQYIETLAQSIEHYWQTHGRAQKLVLSFHGLPQAMIAKGDPYFSHCQTTTKLLIERLKLKADEYTLSFQSRLGVEKWLKPYTMDVMKSLPNEGYKNIQVVCPGFACDCLETLEEINMENRDFFLAAGGEHYAYIPCLNDDDRHIQLLDMLIGIK
jgi:ferrochelatase